MHSGLPPSSWVVSCLDALPAGFAVGKQALDMACGSGRHSLLLAQRGFQVLGVDRDADALSRMPATIQTRCLDLEQDAVWPLAGMSFDVVVVTNYLWRPRLKDLLGLLAPGGVLIYETFMQGNERFGSPKNPDFLLRPDELLDLCRPELQVMRFEQGQREQPGPAMVQRVMAYRPEDASRPQVIKRIADESNNRPLEPALQSTLNISLK